MTQKIYAALIKAKMEFKPVLFDKKNPHFKSAFASLKAIEDATNDALHKNGLSLIQPWSHLENGDTVVETFIIHESGESIKSSCIVKSGKTDQQFGASITYMRRYQAASLLGVVGEEDDDGESDQGRASPPQEYKKAETKSSQAPGMITDKQKGLFFALTKEVPEYRDIVKKRYGSSDNIPFGDFQKVLDHLTAYKANKQPAPSQPNLPESLPGEEECPF